MELKLKKTVSMETKLNSSILHFDSYISGKHQIFQNNSLKNVFRSLNKGFMTPAAKNFSQLFISIPGCLYLSFSVKQLSAQREDILSQEKTYIVMERRPNSADLYLKNAPVARW